MVGLGLMGRKGFFFWVNEWRFRFGDGMFFIFKKKKGKRKKKKRLLHRIFLAVVR